MKTTNSLKTVFFLVLLSALLMSLGFLVGGKEGILMALILSLVMNFGVYWFSDKIVLAMHDAEVLDSKQYPEVYEIMRGLTNSVINRIKPSHEKAVRCRQFF